MKKCLIISNPYSGSSNKIDLKEQMIEKLYKYGYETILIKTEYKNHAYEIAKNAYGVDLIISEGGDGTLHEVITGNLNRDEPILQAIIPTGTTNDVGNMFGLSKNKIDAIDEFMNGEVKDVDFPSINGNSFVYIVGMGQFLHIPYTTLKKDKDRLGHMAYLKNGFTSLMDNVKSYNIMYELDGKKLDATASIILVSNSNRLGGFDKIYPDNFVKLDDGLFEVALIDLHNKRDLLKGAFKLLTSDMSKIDGAKLIKTDNFKVIFNDKLYYNPCIDGEEYFCDRDDYEFKMDNKLKMLIPSKNINKLFK